MITNRSLTGNQSSSNQTKSSPGEAVVSSSSSPTADSTINSYNNNNKSNKIIATPMNTNGSVLYNNSSFNQVLSYEFNEEQEQCLHYFDKWSPVEQTEFVENLLRRMCHFQHGHINNFLKPMLQRDFISSLPGNFYFSLFNRQIWNASFTNYSVSFNFESWCHWWWSEWTFLTVWHSWLLLRTFLSFFFKRSVTVMEHSCKYSATLGA